ncbi:TlyA family RNA methyltransferase [Ferrovibrio terrae]|uniref:TlyA family RNA methyltransferase n=1 Tax=Ferrovibrio terrae TaxID=2594003 RepID=A0A516H1Q7_9PROT|nr:TlyA family RNA methyltransferase [Ferrovibrio terrae]QDO97704.1 TlyA family RNA methyltransferase [Ferrovibrio terrae]
MKAPKLRLDQMLVERGLAESRAKAQAAIMAGLVFSGEKRLDKPGVALAVDTPIELRGKPHPWVSRGGVKLAHAIAHFSLKAEGRAAIDVGASTGGFTDVLLHHGAVKVFAVDVGEGQLDWRLRTDERVVVLEKTNARHLTAEIIPGAIDCVVCDASFIGLQIVLPAALSLARPGAWAVALIKPQFEVGRTRVGKGGVVRDPALHDEVCATIHDWWSGLPGWRVLGIEPSPILGPEGNREFLIAAQKSEATSNA